MTDNQEPSERDNRRKRLIFRSWHRGTKEMDLILGTFAETWLDQFTDKQLEAYERILQLSDPDLYDWISGKKPIPANMRDDILEKLLTHTIPKERA